MTEKELYIQTVKICEKECSQHIYTFDLNVPKNWVVKQYMMHPCADLIIKSADEKITDKILFTGVKMRKYIQKYLIELSKNRTAECFNKMKSRVEEKDVKITEMKSTNCSGYYFVVTDKTYSESDDALNEIYGRQIGLINNDICVEMSVFSNLKDSEFIQQALNIF